MRNAYSIYDAKTHLSSIIRCVKEGREVVISERGHPVAKVIPFQEEESFEERIARFRSAKIISQAERSRRLPQGLKRSGGLRRFLKDRE